ncbi:hypothetical protein DFA_03428 [Cavenderia fasciculata]|uniref:Uncharacterized protein n=1 Tax=Cavenderia fasciculata TaxID=261658 RepID=F4PHJ6_CACFS|nr:uncharacterized protein DFA_03428 [Cavenderia fasciculata]EGG25180.1 hypothetical protein DFA_03428 [Cavenderia fasciculata]|eukprot:XP_004363031.1 hypothetical protein DFA_03428 [Cavenderia fasciculata]
MGLQGHCTCMPCWTDPLSAVNFRLCDGSGVVESQAPQYLYSILIDQSSNWNVTVYDYNQLEPVNQFVVPFKYQSLIGILDFNATSQQFLVLYLNDKNVANTIGSFDINKKQLTKIKALPLQSNCFIDTIPMGYDESKEMIITAVTNLENNTVTLMEWKFPEKQEIPISFNDQYAFDNSSFPTGAYNLHSSTYYTHFVDQDTQLHRILTYNTTTNQYVDYILSTWIPSSTISSTVFLISPTQQQGGEAPQLYGITQVGQQLTLLQIELDDSNNSGQFKSLLQINNPYPPQSIPYVLSSSDSNYLTLFTSTNNVTTTLTTINLSNLQYKSIQSNNNFPYNSWFLYSF